MAGLGRPCRHPGGPAHPACRRELAAVLGALHAQPAGQGRSQAQGRPGQGNERGAPVRRHAHLHGRGRAHRRALGRDLSARGHANPRAVRGDPGRARPAPRAPPARVHDEHDGARDEGDKAPHAGGGDLSQRGLLRPAGGRAPARAPGEVALRTRALPHDGAPGTGGGAAIQTNTQAGRMKKESE